MSSSSENEQEDARDLQDSAEALASANTARAMSYAKSIPPLYANTFMLMGQNDEIRLIVGQQISGELLPSGHVVMTVGCLQALLEAGAEHLKKVAAGRMGPMQGTC